MSSLYFSRRQKRRLLGYLLCCLAFLFLWCLLTLSILFLQDSIFGNSELSKPPRAKEKQAGGVQTIVGHYNGNLPEEKLRNLTDEDLNANNYNPNPEWGVLGAAVKLDKEETRAAEETWAINKFNLVVSDGISLNRSLPDVRKQACREMTYPAISSLPTTSVIIVYHNEAYSTLLRTVWSVINRSPRRLLQEIILVDDYSNRTFLIEPLDDAARQLPVHTKIIRAKERVGLIRARLMGAQEAEGDVLTFLDSHCECTEGWLEPLLSRVKENRTNVVCPVIDVINDDTFQYQKGIELFRGGFNWNLQFRWYGMPTEMAKSRLKHSTDPIESPTMAGGLFSIDRRYFEELGAYDHGMDIWGGENLEISFRIWQCGGRVEILPCSHVGHVFRKTSPHDFPGKSSGKILSNNLFRVAEVWMDEWKHLFYKLSPQAGHLRNSTDVSERIELRKRLKCKSFRWYLDNVFTDHFLPTRNDVFGRVIGGSKNCLAWDLGSNGLKQMDYKPCPKLSNKKIWIWTKDGRIRSDEHLCLSGTQVIHTSGQWMVQLKECAGFESEYWTRTGEKFIHKESGLCLTEPSASTPGSSDLNPPTLEKCGWSHQTWTLRPLQWRKRV